MAEEKVNLPLMMRIHNMTCLARLLKIGFLQKVEPGCRMVQKRLQASAGQAATSPDSKPAEPDG
jgi:hypothetical protein